MNQSVMITDYDFHIAHLIARYLAGELTCAETEELDIWRKKADNEKLFQKLIQQSQFEHHLQDIHSYEETAGWNSIKEKINRK